MQAFKKSATVLMVLFIASHAFLASAPCDFFLKGMLFCSGFLQRGKLTLGWNLCWFLLASGAPTKQIKNKQNKRDENSMISNSLCCDKTAIKLSCLQQYDKWNGHTGAIDRDLNRICFGMWSNSLYRCCCSFSRYMLNADGSGTNLPMVFPECCICLNKKCQPKGLPPKMCFIQCDGPIPLSFDGIAVFFWISALAIVGISTLIRHRAFKHSWRVRFTLVC